MQKNRLIAGLVVALVCVSCKSTGSLSRQLEADGPLGNPCAFVERLGAAPASVELPSNYYNLPWDVFLSTAYASHLAYDPPARIREVARTWGFTTVDVLEEGALAAYVASNERCVLVVFRGTHEIRNWLTNVQLAGRPVQFGRMHSGFEGGLASLKSRILNYIKWQGGRSKTVWVTGHSLGGALAGVLAYENSVVEAARRVAEFQYVVTFGQPLFGDPDIARYMGGAYRKRYFRFVNNKDIVARVPPGYEHFGSLVWFREDQLVFRPQLSQTFVGAAAAAAAAAAPPNGLETAAPAAAPGTVDPVGELEPSQAEFESFMDGFESTEPERGAGFESAAAAAGPVVGAAAAAPASALSYVDDHSMLRYISLIGGQLGMVLP